MTAPARHYVSTLLAVLVCFTFAAGAIARAIQTPGVEPERPDGSGLLYAGFSVAQSPAADRRGAGGSRERLQRDQSKQHGPELDRLIVDEFKASGQQYDAELENLIDQFMETGEDVERRPGGEDRVRVPRTAAGNPSIYQALTVAREDNPLLTKQCRRDAARFSVDALRSAMGLESESAALTAAAAHIQSHLDFIKNELNGSMSYSQYLKAVAECRAFCAPLVVSLVRCHVLSVARRDHGIVLFGFDRFDVDPGYADPNGLIAAVAEALRQDSDRKVLLIGRASKIGNLRYNRRLSARRALSVQDELLALGVSENRVETMWFGWEPPQIDSFIATEYGIGHLLEQEGRQRMNQSVVMVLY